MALRGSYIENRQVFVLLRNPQTAGGGSWQV